jgi:hypothetical protein
LEAIGITFVFFEPRQGSLYSTPMHFKAKLGLCTAPVHKHELSSVERMERMSYTEALYPINRIERS